MYRYIYTKYIDTYLPYIDEAPRHAQTDGFTSRIFMMMLVMMIMMLVMMLVMMIMMIMMMFVALREGEMDHIKAGTFFVCLFSCLSSS